MLDRLPYAKPGGVPEYCPVPAPPKCALVDRLPQEVDEGSPDMSKDASVTSAPEGKERSPANPSPVPVKVWVYDLEPS